MIVTDVNILRLKSSPVETIKEAETIINKLKEEIKNHPNAVGLSAVQLGILKQVAIIKDKDNWHPLINPYLADDLEDPFIYKGEGCLSFPGLHFDTRRYKGVTVGNTVIDNGKFRQQREYYYYDEDKPKDLEAMVVQHEMDHLSGIIFQEKQIVNRPKDSKVGRNDSCPCGSGKKYKKCCLK